jgi:hypothetical protein
MKTPALLALTFFCAVTCLSAQSPVTLSLAASAPASAEDDKQTVNYAIRVEWKDAKKGTNALQVVTCDGNFNLDTISGTTKINDTEIPMTVKVSGTLVVLDNEKGRLQLFLGRTMPYVTGVNTGSGGGKGFASYSQLSVGLNSRFVVTFGQPLVIQTDDSGEVSILVKRLD